MQIFEYAIFLDPANEDEGQNEKPKLLCAPTTVLAKDLAAAQFQAARAVPEEYATRFDELVVAVRPF